MDRISQIQSRIQQIEASFNPSAQTQEKDFDTMLKEAQASTTRIEYSGANPMMSNSMNPMMSMPMSPMTAMNPMNPMAQMNPMMMAQGVNPMMAPNMYMAGPSMMGMQIANAAGQFNEKQYWPNACAHAVNDVLKSMGMNISPMVNNNPDWVPNYENLGQKVTSKDQLQPGDLVIYCNEIGQGGYDHIGIYAGNGMAYNVSTSAGYKFVLTPVGDTFQEGRRLG